jgi:hypothetical protein
VSSAERRARGGELELCWGQKLTGKATQAPCRWIVGPCQPGERRLVRTTINRGPGSAA